MNLFFFLFFVLFVNVIGQEQKQDRESCQEIVEKVWTSCSREVENYEINNQRENEVGAECCTAFRELSDLRCVCQQDSIEELTRYLGRDGFEELIIRSRESARCEVDVLNLVQNSDMCSPFIQLIRTKNRERCQTSLRDLVPRQGLNFFQEAFDLSGFESMLDSSDQQFTIFVPTDASVQVWLLANNWTESQLFTNGTLLQSLVGAHIVANVSITTDTLPNQRPERFYNVWGDKVDIAKKDSQVQVEGVSVTVPDIVACNGVLHIVDNFLWDPSQLQFTTSLFLNDNIDAQQSTFIDEVRSLSLVVSQDDEYDEYSSITPTPTPTPSSIQDLDQQSIVENEIPTVAPSLDFEQQIEQAISSPTLPLTPNPNEIMGVQEASGEQVAPGEFSLDFTAVKQLELDLGVPTNITSSSAREYSISNSNTSTVQINGVDAVNSEFPPGWQLIPMPLSPQLDRPIPQELTELVNLANDIYALENGLYGAPILEYEPCEEVDVNDDYDDDEQMQDNTVDDIVFEPVSYENLSGLDTSTNETQIPSRFPTSTQIPGSFSSGLQYQDVLLVDNSSLKATGQQIESQNPNFTPTLDAAFTPMPTILNNESQDNPNDPFYLQQEQYQSALQIFQSNEINQSYNIIQQQDQDFPVFSMPPLLPAYQQYTYSVEQQLQQQNQSQTSLSKEQQLYANLRAFPASPSVPFQSWEQGQQQEDQPPIFPMPDPIGGSYPLSQVPGLAQNESNNIDNLQLFASQNQQQVSPQFIGYQSDPIPSQNTQTFPLISSGLTPSQSTITPSGTSVPVQTLAPSQNSSTLSGGIVTNQNTGTLIPSLTPFATPIPSQSIRQSLTLLQTPGQYDIYQYQQQNSQSIGGVVAATPLNFGTIGPQINEVEPSGDSIELPSLPVGQQDTVIDACICASDGRSGSIETNRPGCIADEPGQEAFCYVVDPERCGNSSKSVRFEGASWRYCELPPGSWSGLVQEDMDERATDEVDEYGIIGQGQEYGMQVYAGQVQNSPGQVQNSPATKDLREEFPIGCECQEEMNPSNKEMEGCFQHNVNDDPYCYVADLFSCPFANPSKRYTQEAWRYCEIQNPNKIIAQPLGEDEFLQKDACDCTSTGFSGPVDTGTSGCGRYLTLVLASICYVQDPINCPTAIPSTVFPGAAWHTC